MKRLFFISITYLLALSASAQVRQEVVSSAGGYNSNGGLSINWTLGETVVTTFKSQNGNLILTNGFQQKLLVTAVEENIDIPVNIRVYPNPASEVLNIVFENPVDEEIVISILDSQGKQVKTDIVEATTSEWQINLQNLPAGIYFLRLTKDKLINVYKVVKL